MTKITSATDGWGNFSRAAITPLDQAVRRVPFGAVGAAIDDVGGSFVMNFETVLVTATRLTSPSSRTDQRLVQVSRRPATEIRATPRP